MAFWEVEFPRNVSFGAVGGPSFSTQVNVGFSGQESRNRNWQTARWKWKIGLQTPPQSQFSGTHASYIDLIASFFLNTGGQSDAFRFFDHADYKGTSEPLVTLNGNVQLARTRTIGGRSYQQIIYKPITSAVSNYKGQALTNTVFLAGTTTPVTVDATTGIVTGQAAGTLVDFQFHHPARLATDDLQLQLQAALISDWASIELIEVLPPLY